MRETKGRKESKGQGQQRGAARRTLQKKRVCRFCADKSLKADYKEPKILRPFISERGKITPRRITGNCAKHQRDITKAIKRARVLAILPYTTTAV